MRYGYVMFAVKKDAKGNDVPQDIPIAERKVGDPFVTGREDVILLHSDEIKKRGGKDAVEIVLVPLEGKS
jgi:hypothetical protein